MAVTDPIADYLTRIRNAQQAGHRIVEIPASKMKKTITDIRAIIGTLFAYKAGSLDRMLPTDIKTTAPN